MEPFTLAVITDTHIRPEGRDVQAAYPSDAFHTERARRAIELIEARAPDFTVHLGDITHTVPGLRSQSEAWSVAEDVFGALSHPIHMVPGNHDVGDKPDSHATAPKVNRQSCEVFENRFGPTFHSWNHRGCHFVALNSSLINGGIEIEDNQRQWLEQDLEGHERIFLFLHYPPYLHSPDEPSHYDNVAEPGRSWLLSLIEKYRIEAVFSGHVHNFFFSRYQGTQLYSLPSTAFVRPEYSELFSAPPADENGRNDVEKLGFVLIHIKEQGHRVELVRSAIDDDSWAQPAQRCPVGVWLRGGWAREVDLPYGDLDEFRRKTVRNDYPLLSLMDLRITQVRIPLDDLRDPKMSSRIADLTSLGIELLPFTVEAPNNDDVELVMAHRDHIIAWEIIGGTEKNEEMLEAVSGLPVPIALSQISLRVRDDGYVSHFPRQGFDLEDPDGVFALLHPAVERLVFRIPPGYDPIEGVALASRRASMLGLKAICTVELPRGDELRIHDDDRAVATRVARALRAAEAHPEAIVFLDLLEDKDRGYYPRHGLIDRRGNPRLAARVLRGRAP